MSRARTSRLLAAALLAASASIVAAAEPAGARLLGKVKTARADGFDLQEKGGTVAVSYDPAGTQFEVHKAMPLQQAAETAADRPAHMLAGYRPESRDPQSGSMNPAHYMQVQALIFSASFEPPPLTKEQVLAKLQWFKEKVSIKDNNVSYRGLKVYVGLDRMVCVGDPADSSAVAKGKTVHVAGEREGEAKERRLRAARVTVLSPQIPAVEYNALLGL